MTEKTKQAELIIEMHKLLAESTFTPEEIFNKNVVMPKYFNPETNQFWTGRGGMPDWMEAGLLKGKNREEFEISRFYEGT